ncbi:hypothetical protein HMPREF1982_02892 [Clostridiales bacterium oral taxon 876 str. F0540]|nr:hypothetical protein HMPREF1982_02892 [Clostridiales bacterium oral taxon 876 str. F0540]
MKKGDKLFVRIDYKNPALNSSPKDFEEHVEYLNTIAVERYFVGGGFNNAKGGMIIFEAKDIKEAKAIAENDPLIKRNFYNFELYEWELFILSKSN